MELSAYWKQSPPVHILIGGLLRAFGMGGASSPELSKPSTREELEGLVRQFGGNTPMGA